MPPSGGAFDSPSGKTLAPPIRSAPVGPSIVTRLTPAALQIRSYDLRSIGAAAVEYITVASVVIPAGAESRRARSARAHFATPIIGLLVLVILSFFAWKVLNLASTSDHARCDQITFAAIQIQIAVQHGLESETFTNGVSP